MNEPENSGLERSQEQLQKMNQEMLRLNRLGERFSSAMVRALSDLTVRGKGFRDVLRGLGRQLAQIALQAAAKPLGKALGAGLAGLFGVGARASSVSPFAIRSTTARKASPRDFSAVSAAIFCIVIASSVLPVT